MGLGMDYGLWGVIETLFPILFITIFLVVIGTFIAVGVRGAKEWHSNNQSPVLTVEAQVVSRRQNVSHHRDSGSSTWYYVTFQVESGDRMELSMSGREYGLLAEGDRGRLTFQGTRYLGFERV